MLCALAKIFGFFVARRNTKFDNKLKRIVKLNVPVISIGNISFGGTGKTPFTSFVVDYIESLGKKTVIVGLGYRRKSKGFKVVSDGKKIFLDANNAGDEMLLLAMKNNVPVVVNEKKYLAAVEAEKLFSPDCIIVDDGFQHRTLHRDLDIVIIDSETIDEPFLFPKGNHREPIESLNRADIIGLTNDVELTSEIKKVMQNSDEYFKFVAKPNPIYSIIDSEKYLNEGLKELSWASLSGIAKPHRFQGTINCMGINPVQDFVFYDHKDYSKGNISKLRSKLKNLGIRNVITTEKDAVKLIEFVADFEYSGINLWVLPIEVEIVFGEEYLKQKIRALFESS